MLAVVQAGQAGKTNLLLDMHRLRKRVFRDRLGWNVSISNSGLEVDQFDLPETVYLLALSEQNRVVGSWRFLPLSGPTMIRDIWPEFAKTIDVPFVSHAWEGSRFAVDRTAARSGRSLATVSTIMKELFCGLTELCLICGIREVFTLYDARIARLVKRINCYPYETSARLSINNIDVEVGRYVTDENMLFRLRIAAGIDHPLIDKHDLPPVLLKTIRGHNRSEGRSQNTFIRAALKSEERSWL